MTRLVDLWCSSCLALAAGAVVADAAAVAAALSALATLADRPALAATAAADHCMYVGCSYDE